MPLNSRTLSCLTTARESAAVIQAWINGRSFDDYESDRLLRRAVEREFEIIGEALKRVRDNDPAAWEQLPEAARILGFRNRLAHGYDTIDNAVVWGVNHDYLPAFVIALQQRLAGVSGKGKTKTAGSTELRKYPKPHYITAYACDATLHSS